MSQNDFPDKRDEDEDDFIIRLANECGFTAPTVTRWKDGIDVEYVAEPMKRFVRRLRDIPSATLDRNTCETVAASSATPEHVTGTVPFPERPFEPSNEMALSFHRALSDGSATSDDIEDIKRGLRAAFANTGSSVEEPVAWLIEYRDRSDRQRRAVHLHNAVGDYRAAYGSGAKATALFVAPSATRPRFALPTPAEIAAYKDRFRAELNRRMDTSHPSSSPSTEAHAVALCAFVEGRNRLDSRGDAK